MLPDLESLRCFEAACRHLSFRAAAREVALSPPAFSERISRLEEQYATTLFHRTTRTVTLTEVGTRILPEVRALLERARALASLIEDDRPMPFVLEVGTRFELGLSWLLPALRELESRTPHRRFNLVFGDSDDILDKVGRGVVDCVVTSSRLASARYDHARLHEETYVFVARPSVLKKHPLRRAEDATHHQLIDAGAGLPLFRYVLDAAADDEVWRFQRVVHVGTIAGIRARVLAGDGVAVLPRYLIDDDLRRRRLVEVTPRRPLQRDFFRLVWRAGHPRESSLRDLAADLRGFPLR